ncbi:Retrotransposable element SLACSprotein [Trichinella pseudospiralis]
MMTIRRVAFGPLPLNIGIDSPPLRQLRLRLSTILFFSISAVPSQSWRQLTDLIGDALARQRDLVKLLWNVLVIASFPRIELLGQHHDLRHPERWTHFFGICASCLVHAGFQFLPEQ